MVELIDAVKSVVTDAVGLAACKTASCVESAAGKVVGRMSVFSDEFKDMENRMSAVQVALDAEVTSLHNQVVKLQQAVALSASSSSSLPAQVGLFS